MADCHECGAEVKHKNAAGHYREKCADCIRTAAERKRHVESCENPNCVVCEIYDRENAL
jgi:hypothetical protein